MATSSLHANATHRARRFSAARAVWMLGVVALLAAAWVLGGAGLGPATSVGAAVLLLAACGGLLVWCGHLARGGMSSRGPVWRNAAPAEELLDAMIDPMIVIDSQGLVVEANAAVERVFGWPRADLVGTNVQVLMGEPYRSEHDDYIRAYLDTGDAHAIGRIRKVLGRHRSGRDFPVEISIAELGAEVGDRRQFVGMVRDVSDREQMSAMLNHAERLAAVGELAASVAHEVNNPVNTIINCAQLLRDGDDDPTLLEDIDAEATRIAEIVRELLHLSRDNKESVSSLNLHVVVNRTTALLRRRMMSRGVEMVVEVPDDLPLFLGRQQELQQVLLNLVMNAQDALQQKPEGEPKTLWIRGTAWEDPAGSGSSWVGVIVRDNGPGIPEEDRGRIFEPFFTSKVEKGGSGLGLAVSRRIVERYGGRIVVDSLEGEYAEFRIELPSVPPDGSVYVDERRSAGSDAVVEE